MEEMHGAIRIEQTPFEEINGYSVRVAIIPAVFFAQFPDDFSIAHICQAIYRLGFTHIYLAESGVDVLNQLSPRKTERGALVISNYCPAVMTVI